MADKSGRTEKKDFLERLYEVAHHPALHIPWKVFTVIFKCLFTLVLIGMFTVGIVGCVMMIYVSNNFNGKGVPALDSLSLDATTAVYVQNEEGQFELYQQLSGANSIWTPLDEIPLYMQDAVIAIEDERFRDHSGVDFKRTVGAFANLLLHFNSTEYGASTLTQQLIKNITQEDDHSIERKVTEILRALELERNYSKDQILETYLNILPLSDNIYSVGTAALYYFGKDVSDLSLAECALIAGITQNPSKFSPYAHPENARQRQHVVLYKMYELGFISGDEYNQAINEELIFRNGMQKSATTDYYMDLMVEDIITDLMDTYGYSREYANRLVFYGGLTIYSAEMPDKQLACEAIYADEDNWPEHREEDEEDPQSAFFAMDYTGRVIATVGGRGEKVGSRGLNRSTDSPQSPGSSIKPITVFSYAINYNLSTYSTLWQDGPITLPNGRRWPANYEAAVRDNGPVIFEYAVQKSLNTVPVQIMSVFTPQRCFDWATQTMGLSTLVDSDVNYAPLALGAFTYGVTCRDMAAAYAVFGNGGYYNKPYTYFSVDQNGVTLLNNTPTYAHVMDVDSAYVVNRLLQRVMRGPNGTARAIASSWSGMEVFAKTGTAESKTDVYFAGGTPYYVATCWFGYDYDQTLRGTQTGGARNLWNKCMLALHDGLENASFELKGTTVERKYCTASGLLATSACPDTELGVYKADNIPGFCTVHSHTAPEESTSEDESPATSSTTTTTTTTTTATTPRTTADTPVSVPSTAPTAAPTAAPVNSAENENEPE